MTDTRAKKEGPLWELEAYLSSKQKDAVALDGPIIETPE